MDGILLVDVVLDPLGSLMSVVRRLASVAVGSHGMIHILGFVVAWKLATIHTMSYSTSLLGGSVDVGAGGIRATGVVWLLLAVSFVVGAVEIWRRASWAPQLIGVTASVSAVACLLAISTASAGLVIDLGILAWLWFSRARLGQVHPAR
ncbi:MAG TPA: hypothetical protein VID68_08350 [Solirubrobacteraceae bacterium]